MCSNYSLLFRKCPYRDSQEEQQKAERGECRPSLPLSCPPKSDGQILCLTSENLCNHIIHKVIHPCYGMNWKTVGVKFFQRDFFWCSQDFKKNPNIFSNVAASKGHLSNPSWLRVCPVCQKKFNTAKTFMLWYAYSFISLVSKMCEKVFSKISSWDTKKCLEWRIWNWWNSVENHTCNDSENLFIKSETFHKLTWEIREGKKIEWEDCSKVFTHLCLLSCHKMCDHAEKNAFCVTSVHKAIHQKKKSNVINTIFMIM